MPKTHNKSLDRAKKERNDEFYTRLSDIENELYNYREHFKDKVILCNCDDPRVSNFFHYFYMNFRFFGLKKLIATCYKNQQWDLFSEGDCEKAVYIMYEGPSKDNESNPLPQDEDIRVMNLEGDGDFRSPECKIFLEMADIVVTNPPFSLFREFVGMMMDYNKKFVIVGSKNNVCYKEIFPLVMDRKIWLGKNSIKTFERPGKETQDFGNVGWFTNIEYANRSKEGVMLCKRYSPEEYPMYDNYDAINVDKVADIPVDYHGPVGVPVSFIEKWNPSVDKEYEDIVTTNDFEIIGISEQNCGGFSNGLWKKESGVKHPLVEGKKKYARVFIKRKPMKN